MWELTISRVWIAAAALARVCPRVLTEGSYTLTLMEAGSVREETKSPLVFTWLTGEVQKRSLPIGRAARCSRRSSVSQRQRGHPSEHSSSPFIWFYLRPQAQPLYDWRTQAQFQPRQGRRRLFSRWFIFRGKPFLSLSLLSCPQLARARFSVTVPSAVLPLSSLPGR